MKFSDIIKNFSKAFTTDIEEPLTEEDKKTLENLYGIGKENVSKSIVEKVFTPHKAKESSKGKETKTAREQER